MPKGWKSKRFKLVIQKGLVQFHDRPSTIRFSRLCKGDYNAKLKIDCFDYDSVGDPDFIGTCTTSLQELIENGNECAIS